ncbi:hypothetical protein SLEP1_g23828 [Rubroshorea leprosula]|uniref:Pentatricopeptide repeat-containing protein n=1 Tax=Rubroshorea leprosula TaxID=152421 RepID=A0AAV5JKV5_9ROSI|nr:hypothetical protein SLEP1_g23828 [Rubroshorea leprosula]
MLLQPSSLHTRHVSLPSSFSCSRNLPFKVPHLTLIKVPEFQKLSVTCSISQIHSYGTVDYERRPMIKWNSIFKKISLMEKPELGSATVLNEFEKGGRKLTKWELCRVVRELRKFKRYRQALEVYDWMNNRVERFRFSASDAAIQLDLIAKVRGVSSAEDFFLNLPDTLKDKRVYGSLLNGYVRARMRDKAESLIEKMRDKGYVRHPLPFNVMMTLYMNLKEYDKVDSMVEEMKQKGIPLDLYSYNIWLTSCGSQGSVEKMEQVCEEMKADRNINPHWTTFSTLATMYINMGLFEKAEECLRKVESIITGRDRMPYHYLVSLYGTIGKKEEVYRAWKVYKSMFPSIPNMGYHAMISSLVRIGDIEGAENIYDEWLSVKSSYDPRVVNLMMDAYNKEGNLDKAESLFNQMVEAGGKPNPTSWEILAEGHIRDQRISEALSCLKEAFAIRHLKSWKPKPVSVLAFFDLCEEEADAASRDVLVGLLRQSGFLKSEAYASLIGLSDEAVIGNELLRGRDRTDSSSASNEEEKDSEALLSQLQGSA